MFSDPLNGFISSCLVCKSSQFATCECFHNVKAIQKIYAGPLGS